MPSELLADVAIRAAMPGVEAVFTYRVPPELRSGARPGQLVWAPLRRQRVQGVILDLYTWETSGDGENRGLLLHETPAIFRPDPEAPPDADAPVVRDLLEIADPEAALTPAQLRFARWLSEYYCTPLYEALALMLPPGVSQEADITWRATPEGLHVDLGGLPERERAVLYYLRQHGELPERELRRSLRGADTELRQLYAALLERGLVARGASVSRPGARPRLERLVRLRIGPDEVMAALAEMGRAPRQRAILERLLDATTGEQDGTGEGRDGTAGVLKPRPAAEDTRSAPPGPLAAGTLYPLAALLQAAGANQAALHALERRGLVEVTTREVRRDPLAGHDVPPDVPPPLTPAQERVWREIATALEQPVATRTTGADASTSPVAPPRQGSTSAAFLLHGVTGSGKTEIYLRAIGRALRLGRQALVLVPEIALTTQLVRRFAARFPGRLAVLHSGLSLGERYDEWRRLRNGKACLAIGSRSAVFAPLPGLGLIIVDEEHEPTYKHDGPPRYHARDAARRLAELTGSVLILGSATPSVETYAAARAGRVRLLELAERVGLATDAQGLPRSHTLPLPPVRIVDMRDELRAGNRSIFSRPLQQALSRTLTHGEQAILFLNRRGAATFVMCRDCGHVVTCPNCSAPLAVHYRDEAAGGENRRASAPVPQPEPLEPWLVCHSCNHRALLPQHCPACWSARIKSFGVGTQRVVEEVELLYPDARVIRWDRDSAGRKGDHARLLTSFLRHEADVLVGTQMIAKGLDLPLVSVVGVVAADTGLHLPDFRAGERSFQLLTQVAGRAGRRRAGAEVCIQTYTPDHYALRAAQEHDYGAFFTQEIAFRRQTQYPPYSRLVRFVYSSPNDDRCRRAAEALVVELGRLAEQVEQGDWGIIGPAPAFFHRQRNRFRWHVILRSADPTPLLASLRLPPGWSIDIDPVHVL